MAAAAVCLFSSAVMLAQDRVAKLESEFEQEENPVRKARRLPKLGDAQLGLVSEKVAAGEIQPAFELLEKYRDWVKAAHQDLKASGINAEKKPNGFKHLQIHLRGSIRQLGQTITRVPVEYRPWFTAVRGELEAVNRELLEALFPRRPHQ